jgi:L-fuculose-phosphate aldolase
MSPRAAHQRLIAAARRTVELGLNHGTTGNLSVRFGEGFLITPTGMPCDALRTTDLVAMGMDGSLPPGSRAPSSEWRLHRDIYAASPDRQGIVHAHPTFATTLACLRLDLPAVHYMIAVTGGSVVRCASYATFGTEVLSAAAIVALGDGKACLLANHGLLAVGADLAEALRVAVEVEQVAELFWRARQMGDPVILSEAEMAEVLERFRGYGGQATP